MKVSVCVASYNGAGFISAVFPSIFNQLAVTDEVLVIDDASQDETVAQLHAFSDKRLKIYEQEKNRGVSRTFYHALALASGDVVVLADQDDDWKAEKMGFVRKYFEENEVDVLVHDATIVCKGERVDQTLFDVNKSGTGVLKNFRSCAFTGCCSAYRRELVQALLPVVIFSKVYYDHYLGLMASLVGLRIRFEAVELINWQRHGDNLTDTFHRRPLLTVFWDRFLLALMLLLNLPIVCWRLYRR